MVKVQSHKKVLLIDLTTYVDLNTTERNAYAFYVSLMLKYNNNIIKDHSIKKLSQLTKVHRNSVKKYLNILLKWSYIEYKNKDLHIIPFKKDRKLYKFYLYRSLSAEKTKQFIEIEILRLHINRQKYAIEFKKDLRSRNKMTNKRLKRNANLVHGDFNKNVFFSYRYASKKLNVSISKIQTLLRSANDNYLIKTENVYKFMCKLKSFKEFKKFKYNLNKNFDTFFNLRFNFKDNSVYLLVGTNIDFRLDCH